ncbi:MAG: helix-turn-helix transcriptional regulator, partial [Myxococcales bacterium]|nr:helix-turn-helix transcriptional regulator [Myxococcales bacterium]
MTRAGDLRWVREPRQSRSRETLDRILDAAEALVAEKGFEDATVAEIVRRGGSSVGAFYTRFRDKDGLLYALYERYMEQAILTADDALDPQRWEGAS